MIKTKKYIIQLFLSMIVLMIVSCEPKIVTDVEVPNVPAKLVLFGFLSPDDSGIEVEVSMSAPIFGSSINSGDLTVSNANVQISNGTLSVNIPFNTVTQMYQVSQSLFPIVAGQTYTITASANGLSVKGSTTIPKNIIYSDKANVKLITNSATYEEQYIFTFSWKDEPAVKNYYRVHFEKPYENWGGDSAAYSLGDGMFKDENKDGTIISGQFEHTNYSGAGLPQIFYLYLLNTDINYYEYHRRRLVYFGDDPFSEPFQQYSNVEGGLGVVSSFRKSRIVVTP